MHGLEVLADIDLAAGGLLHVLHGEAVADFNQSQSFLLADIKDALN